MNLQHGAGSGPENHTCEFGDAVEPHLPRMFRAARQIVRSDDLAWDAVQITLLRLWRADGVDEGHACGVLLRVVRLVSLEVLRAGRRRDVHETAAADEECVVEEPSRRLERREVRRQLQRLIEELPDECREVTERRLEEGSDYRQLARDLDVPIGTVRSRLHRARRLLADRLVETSAA